jgi:hypothetical protein
MTGFRNIRHLALPLLVVAAVAALFGCGGSEGGSASGDQPLSKAEFIKSAEAICLKGIAEKEKLFSAGLESGKSVKYASTAELKEFVESVAVEPYSKVVAGLAQLHPRTTDKAAIAVVHSYETAQKDAEANPLGAMKQNPYLKPDQVAAAYGIKSCEL